MSNNDEGGNRHKVVKPGVSYFIVFQENTETNDDTLFATLHDCGLDATVSVIKTRSGKVNLKDELLSKLKGVLKVS